MRNMMLFGHRRFNEFLEIERGHKPKDAFAKAKRDAKNGLIKRKVTPGALVAIEYRINESGMALKPVLDQLMLFSLQHYPQEVCKDGRPKTLEDLFWPVS
jgi:DNA-binding HxlR family transcriptional regulator